MTMDTPNNSSDTPESVPPSPPVPPPPAPETALPPPRPFDEAYQKSPALAAFLSILPGLGHLYAGAYQRAAMVLISFVIPFFLDLPLPVPVFWCLFVWFFGIIDAYRQAQLANLAGGEPAPKPAPVRQGGLMFGVFMVVVGGILLINRFYPIDLEWLADWWPAVLVLIGVWVIIGSLRDRAREKRQSYDFGGEYDEE
jgi:hypothetical protein